MSTDNKNFGGKDQGKQKPLQNPQQPNRTGTQGGQPQGGFQKPGQSQGGHQQGQNKAWDQNKGGIGGKKEDHR